MRKVLSIVVSYNFEPWLDTCLDSLFQSDCPTDVMVVDNDSKDETVFRIKRDYPQAILVESRENIGFGKANNIGFEYAIANDYDAVFLMNQDAWVDRNCLSRLMDVYVDSDQVGIISPMHYDGTGNQLDEGFAAYINNVDQPQTTIFCAPFVNAAFWLIPIQTLRKVGHFSALFYHYGEDSDYGNRLHYHGLKFLVHRDAIAYHDRQTRTALHDDVFLKREYIYFLAEYANINYPVTKAFAFSVLAAIKKVFKPRKSDKKRFTSAYLKIAWQLLLKTSDVLKTRQANA
ncbi:glycosyltransferase [Sphingobacterium corticis]|uniref:Glycosyltransferase n=1 Tax=Sphingobacterium corticis TaxID=1812823 RepID=A0ABW5NH15_9SPHI